MADKSLSEDLESIRRRLIGDVSDSELRTLQLQVQAIDQLTRLAYQDAGHDHDHMDDHDHAMRAVAPIVSLPSEAVAQQEQGR